MADTVMATVSKLHVYVPTWYPWTDSILPPDDLRLRVVLEAGDSAFSPVGFANDGEWYRLQTDLGSEPSTDRPRPLGFDQYETLNESYSQAVPRVDVFGGWSIGVYLWRVQASDESGPNTSIRDYRPARTELLRGLWAGGLDARFPRTAVGTQRFVARLESPYGVFESPHNEYSTRVSFRGTYPLDPNGREFLRWIATFLGLPYELGGRWYGGRVGMGTGQGNAYEGYGIDCSGLISAAAEWAGYGWSPWYTNTTGLDSTSYSSPIPSNAALPGDILNKAGRHVVAIVHRYGTSDVIDIIEAMGTDNPPTERPDNVVRIWPGRDIKRNYVSRGYVPRRLTP